MPGSDAVQFPGVMQGIGRPIDFSFRWRKTALAWAAQALDLDGRDSAVLYNVACLYVVLGRTEDALGCLRRVVRSHWRKEWIKNDPDLIGLRGLKEFQRLTS
jgi:hypothetical protein